MKFSEGGTGKITGKITAQTTSIIWVTVKGNSAVQWYSISVSQIVSPWTVRLSRRRIDALRDTVATITVTNQLSALMVANQIIHALKDLPNDAPVAAAAEAVRPLVEKYSKTPLSADISSAARIHELDNRGAC